MSSEAPTLLLAAQRRSPAHMSALLEQGRDPNREGNFNFSYNDGQIVFNGTTTQGLAAAYFAIANGQEEALELLLKHGLDLNAQHYVHTNPLEAAILGGSVSLLRKCIDNGAVLNVQNHYGKTALYIAADEQMTDAVNVLLQNGASPDIQENELRWGALHKAAFHGNAEIVSALIRAKADINLLTSDGDTPLHMAAWKNHPKIAKLLIQAGAKVNIQRKDEQSALFVASAYHNPEVANQLIRAGCRVDSKDCQGRTAFHNVATSNDIRFAKMLLKHGADVNGQNKSGDTALHLAALKGSVKMFNFLVSQGADMWHKGWGGCTTLHDACSEGHIEIVKAILKSKPSREQLNMRDNAEMTALGSAITADREDIFRLLLAAGCNPQARYRKTSKNCLLHWAAYNNSHKCLLVLLQRRSLRADVRNLQGTTALHVAAMKGNIALMKILMDFGANPCAETSAGDNLFHLALLEGKGEVVKFLLERKSVPRLNVNLENRNGASPLSIAAEKGDIDSVELLIKAGAHAYKSNKQKRSPLHYAASHGNVKIARALIKTLSQEHKVNLINTATIEGWTALHIATDQQHVDFVKYLLERGADPNAVGPNGHSALHMAVQKGCLRMFTLLCAHGADLSLCTDNGESVMHVAAMTGATDILQSLLVRCPEQVHAVQEKFGGTPLVSALSYKHPEAAKLLIEYGAPLSVETFIWRDAPLDFACNSGMLETARLLIKNGVDVHHLGFLNRTALHWAALSGNSDLILELLRMGVDPYIKDLYGFTAKDFAVQQKNREATSTLTWWPTLYRPHEELPLEITKEEDMPERFICPISRTVMHDPVFAADGFAYERSQIRWWLNQNNVSPMTRRILPNDELITAHHITVEILDKVGSPLVS